MHSFLYVYVCFCVKLYVPLHLGISEVQKGTKGTCRILLEVKVQEV